MDGDHAFLGRGWGFPPVFGASGALQMVEEAEDIRQSLHILLSTAPGERVMQADYGCGLKRLVFDYVDASLVTEIKDLVERAILFFEPRVDVKHVSVDASEIMEGVLHVHVDYTVRTTNSRHNMVYPFYINEGTNVSL